MTRDPEMEAYDQLPRPIRDAMKYSRKGFSARNILEFYLNHGVMLTLAAIKRADNEP